MEMKISAPKALPMGVDLGYSRLKMAQVQRASDIELLAADSVEVPADCRDDALRRRDFQCQAIRSLLRTGGFHGRKAILSLPSEATFLRSLKVPSHLAGSLDDVIRGELQSRLPFAISEAIIRHVLVDTCYGDREGMEELIVVAAPRSMLDEHLAMAHRAGLEIVGINIDACAVVECFARLLWRTDDHSRIKLFLDIGSKTTQVVMARGQRMAFARNLTVGGLDLDRTVSEAMDIPIERADHIRREMASMHADAAEDDLFRLLDARISWITDEIMGCVRYCESVFRVQTIDSVVFAGGEAHNKRLCQCIAKRLGLPARIGDPMAGIRLSGGARGGGGPDMMRGVHPSWAVAVGLSLGAQVAA